MGEYDAMIAMAARLIDKKGLVVDITNTVAFPDATRPWEPTNVDTVIRTKAVMLDRVRKSVAGQTTKIETARALIPGAGLDGVQIDSNTHITVFDPRGDPPSLRVVEFQVAEAERIAPAGQAILWDVALEG